MKTVTSKNHSKDGDVALVKAAQKGDQKALQELVKKYEQTVYGFSFKVCRNQDDAEDTLQEAFLSILKSLKSFNFKSSFSTWIYRIVSNSCLMKFRKEKRDRWESFEQLDRPEERIKEFYIKWPDSPAEEVLSDELKNQMDRAILELPPIYRLAFVLKDLEGLKIEDVAEALNISVPAAKARLRRARLFLRDKLEPYVEQ
ncbi:RNA polymerase sigma factor [candidate division KSB1 bacterium]|nr:RNA polymerase sigma factor [candidate division KSB1 bacterium]NIR72669.1 RNA polymerase sigma factor [candidate division KSB1 bacterium]NIS25136.1 RNA polymerase sigma factor [candidate division KSB1 bacterium]NIT72043.1 RNA polymerase sigma factor [candidate division KSB1 bacterium]NIU25835.1 RNA polymerase sigma factor [candidate division KSB1 bacterium]